MIQVECFLMGPIKNKTNFIHCELDIGLIATEYRRPHHEHIRFKGYLLNLYILKFSLCKCSTAISVKATISTQRALHVWLFVGIEKLIKST